MKGSIALSPKESKALLAHYRKSTAPTVGCGAYPAPAGGAFHYVPKCAPETGPIEQVGCPFSGKLRGTSATEASRGCSA